MSQKQVITYFNSRHDFIDLQKKNPGLIILKLGATWCGPCKRIQPSLNTFFSFCPDTIICCDVDIDESTDLYIYLKSKKMVNGVPAILVYKKNNTSYIPDDSVVGSDLNELNKLFNRCKLHLDSITQSSNNAV